MSSTTWRWAALCLIAVPVCAQQTELSKRRQDKDDPRARAEFIHRQRGRAEGGLNAAELRRQAIEQRDAMIREQGDRWRESMAAQRSRESRSAATSPLTPEVSNTIAISSSTWTEIGPRPTKTRFGAGSGFYQSSSGRVTALAVDPCDASGNTAYLGGAQGGVWKTTNGGTSWTPLTDSQASLAVGSLAVAKDSPAGSTCTIYVGTGEQSFSSDSYYGAGILKSTDGGQSWTRQTNPAFDGSGIRALPGLPSIGGMAIQPGGTTVALAAVDSNVPGIYRTNNSGASWAQSTGITSTATAVAFAPNDANVAFAGVFSGGVFRSNDGGQSFTNISAGTAGMNLGRVELAVFSKDVLYAAVSNDAPGSLSGVFKTVNGTAVTPTWTRLNNVPDFCNPQCWYDLVIAVSPVNQNVVFVGGSANAFIQRSVDGGTTWTEQTGSPETVHVDQHSMAFSPDGTKLYLGNDGGAYRTTSPAATSVQWDDLNATLGIAQFYQNFALHPTDENQTLGGTQDNSIQYFSGLLQWDDITCGDGAGAVIDPGTPTTAYVNCQNVDVRRSTSLASPVSYSPADGGISLSDETAFIPPLIGDGLTPGRVYFAGSKVWRTDNGGLSNWIAISPDLPSAGHHLTTLAVNPANVNIVWAGADQGTMFRGTPNSISLNAIGTGSGASVRAIAFDPRDVSGNIVYVAQAGFTTRRISRTANGAALDPTWADISNGLPTVPVNDIVVDPDIANTLYVATDLGVYISGNNGTSWAPLANGLPNVAVFGLKLHRPSRTLRAATHGRGMWDLYVPFTVTGPGGSVQPGGAIFAGTAVGATSASKTLTFTSIGTSTTTIFSVTANSTEFPIVQNNCVGTVPPGGNCTVLVSFQPAIAGARSGTLTITSNASNSGGIFNAALSGTGVVAPTNDQIGNAKNIGKLNFFDALTVNDSTVTSFDATDPHPPLTCVLADGDGTFHSLWYKYTPAQNGALLLETVGSDYDTVISMWTGSPGSLSAVTGGCADDIVGGEQRQSRLQLSVISGTQYYIMVSGYYPEEQGTLVFSAYGPSSSAPPILNTSTLALTFAAQNVGTASAPQSIMLTAPNADLGDIRFTLAGDYGLSTDCGFGLKQGASCSANVTFAPTASGSRPGSLLITSSALHNLAVSPVTVTLNGTGNSSAVAVTPAAHAFSAITGTFGAPVVFTFSNNSGGTITVANVATTGDYSQTNSCGSVPNGASCLVSVTFKPTAAGNRSGTLTFTHNGPGGSTVVALAGTGLNFGLVLGRPVRGQRSSASAQIAIAAGQSKMVPLTLDTSSPGMLEIELDCLAPRGITCGVSPGKATLNGTSASLSVTVGISRSRLIGTERLATIQIVARSGSAMRTLSIPVRVLPRGNRLH